MVLICKLLPFIDGKNSLGPLIDGLKDLEDASSFDVG